MTTSSLLQLLHDKGVELWAEGEKLRFSAPRGALSDDLRSQLAAKKTEILAALRDSDNGFNGNGNGRVSRNGHAGANGHTSAVANNAPANDGREQLPTAEYGPGSTSHATLYRQRFQARDEKWSLLDAAPPYFRHVNPCQAHMLQMIDMDKRFVRGKGAVLYDDAGNQYLDFVAAYGALPFGHNPDEVWGALQGVCARQTPNFVQPSLLDAAGELAERLISVAPQGMRFVTFANSGAEAVEAALKLCRSTTGRPGILSTTGSFHGKTLGALSATGKRHYQTAYNAPAQDFHYAPFGDAAALQQSLDAKPGYFAAVIVEPIQGEGGIIQPPEGYLAEVAKICRDRGTLLVVDEVQTGLGRTGAMFACDHEGVTPDVITLAKALGGGLMPIGAVMYTESVLNEQFAMQHTSTFAGNTLACRAGLAVLEMLKRNDAAVLGHVRRVGEHLKSGLAKLAQKYPAIVKSVRGRGLMLGIQFNLASQRFRRGFLRYLADQQLFTYTLATYLLNVHRIRVAPTLSAPDVLRIQPPLIIEQSQCDQLLAGLDETLAALEQGDAAHVIAHLVAVDLSGRPRPTTSANNVIESQQHEVAGHEGRFAFLTHLLDEHAWSQLDPSLGIFTAEEMAALRSRVADLLDPVSVGEVTVESATGQRARGEFVMLPYTAEEMIEMPYERALAEVRYAVQLCASRGAKIVGLGGFNSIVTQGGTALAGEENVALTTGNSFTVAAGIQALQSGCQQQGRSMPECAAAVIGATGALGKALSTKLAAQTSRLLLVGNPAHPQRSRTRLLDVAAAILRHLRQQHEQGETFAPGTIGQRLASIAPALPHEMQDGDYRRLAEDFDRVQKCLVITTEAEAAIQQADLVVTATSSVERLAAAESFRQGAIVCELSRPFNIGAEVRRARPDVLCIEGGLVRMPGEPDFGFATGLPKGVTFACAAETIMLALEKTYQDTSIGIDLDVNTIDQLEALSQKHGFNVVV